MASSGVYKLDDGKPYLSNCFPAKNLLRMPEEGRGHWLVARKCSLKKKPRGVVEARAEGQESQKVSFEVGGKKGSRQENQVDTPGHVLDQAFLLKHHCVKNPSDLCNINVSGLKFSKAKEKDFKHFNSVIYINASENLLPLEAFHTFPVLKELELAFNGIKTVYVKYGDFKSLEFLDLSFNSLTAEAICDLGILPHLRVLLLTGNGLTSLPPNLAVAEQEAYVTSLTSKRYILRFPALETLMLDDNKLSNPNCFASLAGLSRLKKLSLDQNKIFRIPYLQQVQLRDGSGDWVGGRGSPRKEPQSMLQPKSWIFEASDDQPDYTVLPMKKDVDRTEVVFSSHPGFSTSETTKVCALPPIFETLPVKSLKARNQTLALPFPELRYLSLAYNKIAKEDAILPVALFPSLCELIFHNNPLVAHTQGVPPLLKSFLQERLGIHLIRRKMVKAKHHILMPRKDSRKVSGLSSSIFQRDDTEIKEKDQRPPPTAPREVKRTQKKLPSASFPRKYHGSEELLTAKPDPAFTEPKGIQKNAQALQHMLKHPLVYRSCKPRLDTLQKHYVPKEKRTQRIPIPPPRKTRAQLLDDVLIRMRDPWNMTEAPLGAVLCQRPEQRLVNQKQYLEAKRLLKEFRARYRRLVRCSLRLVFGATAPPQVRPALSEGQPKKFGRFLEFMDEFCQEPTASDSKG
ncbi:X-ray radiation resistance-associated protein 1 isoform X6 [Balaenoptera acutorostrata]|uniref:X-ray radiation resistance-associated protein 1 isoform X6 n=1 Tax=Balaenoptera acutorostrata TaxID=9767 RepID=A0ABM3U3U5_BALAC|nr:X-ray radiation resistance-associated protein 1 isoform X6 [Balaenoptera acutorostrata]